MVLIPLIQCECVFKRKIIIIEMIKTEITHYNLQKKPTKESLLDFQLNTDYVLNS